MKSQILATILSCCYLLINENQCAKIPQKRDVTNYSGRILNGDDDTDPELYPYLVQLQLNQYTRCGGSIIHEHFILTAAQCISNDQCHDLSVFASNYTRHQVPEIIISDCSVYETFNPTQFLHDIGLVRTVQNLVTEMNLGLIPLPAQGTIYPEGSQAVILGWGETEESGFSDNFRSGVVLVENWSECNYAYQNAEFCEGSGECPVVTIPIEDFCTIGESDYPSSACVGDFGGPVVINGKLAGIMSGAITEDYLCLEGHPSLHLAVANYLWWIDIIIHSEE